MGEWVMETESQNTSTTNTVPPQVSALKTWHLCAGLYLGEKATG